jgi:hypothetical protein
MTASRYLVCSSVKAVVRFFVEFAVGVSADQIALDGARVSIAETSSRDGDYFQFLVCHGCRGVVSKLPCCLASSLLEEKQP